MIQFWNNCFHMRPNLCSRPILICHMFYTKINQLLHTGIVEPAIIITPLAIHQSSEHPQGDGSVHQGCTPKCYCHHSKEYFS